MTNKTLINSFKKVRVLYCITREISDIIFMRNQIIFRQFNISNILKYINFLKLFLYITNSRNISIKNINLKPFVLISKELDLLVFSVCI